MQLGFTSMNTPDDVAPDILAVELEAMGYTSLFIGEHSHIPVSRRTPYPGGGELPSHYFSMMDPFQSLLLAARATEKLQVGLGVCLVLEHHILTLAKAAISLDHLTGGRLLFGVGVGWNAEELENHRPDIPWKKRYRATEEAVGALRACWTMDEAEYHGEFFDFDPVFMQPKPLQSPHPPILCGTSGKLGTQHALRWADEWMPVDAALGNVEKVVTKFRSLAAEAGRDIPISMVTYGDPTPDTLRHYAELGFRRTIIGADRTNWTDPTTALPFAQTYAPFIEELEAINPDAH